MLFKSTSSANPEVLAKEANAIMDKFTSQATRMEQIVAMQRANADKDVEVARELLAKAEETRTLADNNENFAKNIRRLFE